MLAEYKTELEEREAVIDFNRQREKTTSQKVAEGEELKLIEAEKAKERKMRKPESVTPIWEPQEQWSKKKRTSLDTTAKKIGLGSATTYDKAKKIVDKAKAEVRQKTGVKTDLQSIRIEGTPKKRQSSDITAKKIGMFI